MPNYKVVVTVPEKDSPSLLEAIGQAGGGQIGNYTYCSFSSKGTGRFLPNPGASPAIGGVGKLEEVIEDRIEISCTDQSLKRVISAIKAAHPYEEPVIDVYKLESTFLS